MSNDSADALIVCMEFATCEEMHAVLGKHWPNAQAMPPAAYAAYNHSAIVTGFECGSPHVHARAQQKRKALNELHAQGVLNKRELAMLSDLAPQSVDETARFVPQHQHNDAALAQVHLMLARR